MTYVTLVALVVAVGCLVCAVGLAGAFKGIVREHARERQLLINQILHLTGKTWTPPPAEQWQPAAVDDDRGRYVAVPEQMPDDEDWERER